jgi:prevent-host-death family protein
MVQSGDDSQCATLTHMSERPGETNGDRSGVERVGVRALQQHASKVIRSVSEGATVEVTDRGRLVARVVPVTRDAIEVLVDSGQARRASRGLAELDRPLSRKGRSLSDLLADARASER